jgi:hypothetical protein
LCVPPLADGQSRIMITSPVSIFGTVLQLLFNHHCSHLRARMLRLTAIGYATARSANLRASPPLIGPYNTSSAFFSVPALDSTRREAWVVWPESNSTSTFPLLTYLHGDLGGGVDLLGYSELFIQLASYGFIVAAPFSCDTGCKDSSVDPRWTNCLPGLPPVGGKAWAPWYAEGLKTIDWARNMTSNASANAIFRQINWSAGVGLVGHSMGGQVGTGIRAFCRVCCRCFCASELHDSGNH